MSRSRRRLRMLRALLVALVMLLILVCSCATWTLLFRAQTDVAAGRPVRIEIPKGAASVDIARRLAEEGVIANPVMFRVRVRLASADDRLRSGTYDLETGMPYARVIERLMAGPRPEFVSVTIPEGFTVDQVAARLEAKVGIPATETLALAKGGSAEFAADHPLLEGAHAGSLEGYLFPKTYRFPTTVTAREALETMLDQFDREFATVDITSAADLGLSASDVVVAASVIEREAQLDKERRLIASVIVNRLRRNMLLEIDATVEYVIPGNHFRLRYRDLGIKSPYNTYLYRGLPAGPISNPGLASLRAAGDPASTDYYYYVLTGKDGSHTFATNKADFERAKRKSKEVFGR